jgi:hypothetical protein
LAYSLIIFDQLKVPPIVITKAHSVASVDSSLAPSTSANAVTSDTKNSEQLNNNNNVESNTNISEKPPAIIEKRTQTYEYGEAPNLIEQGDDNQAITRQVKPIVINSPEAINEPTILSASGISKAEAVAIDENVSAPFSNESTPWCILIRRNSSCSKDIVIEIPTMDPFMTVSNLKSKIHVEPNQQIKLIHLGKILEDNSTLVPSSCSKSLLKNNAIKVANRGVIQAMIYKK